MNKFKNLWAPWRFNYIKSKKDGECVLCKKAKTKDLAKDYVLKKGLFCYSLLNLYPYNNGHVMVAPYKHTGNFLKLQKEEVSEIIDFIMNSQKKLQEKFNPDGFNIGLNQGKASGAGIDGHIHFHIVPRWRGDTNFMTTLANVKVIPETLDSIYNKLRA